MLNDLMIKGYLLFNKIKIIHSIKGRLRLFVPGLNKIPEKAKEYENLLTSIIKIKPGIQEIQYSYLTNKVLIIYDSEKLSENDILEWLNIIFKDIINSKNLVDKNSLINNTRKSVETIYKKIYEDLRSKYNVL